MTKRTSASNENIKQRNYTPLIWVLSIVAIIIIISVNYIPRSTTGTIYNIDLKVLPLINVILNGITFVFLVLALIMIRRKNIQAHRRFIYGAFTATFLFLITYLTYHALAGSTSYGGEGVSVYIYRTVLISHIILAAAILPLSLITLASGLNMQKRRHRNIARWTMPIWFYVNISAVVVYLMISPYY